jgi:feruloyl esterase
MDFRRPIAAALAASLGFIPAFAPTASQAAALTSRTVAVAPQTTSQRCAHLTFLRLPHAEVTVAQLITSGSFLPPGSTVPITGLPVFCRVAGISAPTTDSHINFEVWIPAGAEWNLKYQQVGNGGFAGTVPYSSLAAELAYGYAVAGTDDGHTGSSIDGTWALGHPQKIIDFGYRALKETTDKSRTIIEAFTGVRPHRSYFDGCSDGGREALMEAERYPDDFDGIVAGSPANFWSRLLTSAVWSEQALLDSPADFITPAQLPILTEAALAQCSGKDGGLVSDGFLNDPRTCHFDASVVQCKTGQSSSTCLSAAQVAAANKLYSGVLAPQTHAILFPGLEPGSEAYPANWPAWITGATPGTSLAYYFGQQYFANFIFDNPTWPITALNFTTDIARADSLAPVLNSTNPNLSRFIGHGGKLIQYVGWADSAIPPKNDLNYYNSVLLTGYGVSPGGVAKLENSYRLYMVPGMSHCGGGPGPNEFGNAGLTVATSDADHNVVLALDRWVEKGVAPGRIVATKYVADNPAGPVAFQRPLCPYPESSRYEGGNPKYASSFACVVNRPAYAADLVRAVEYLTRNYNVLFNPRGG